MATFQIKTVLVGGVRLKPSTIEAPSALQAMEAYKGEFARFQEAQKKVGKTVPATQSINVAPIDSTIEFVMTKEMRDEEKARKEREAREAKKK